MSNTTITLNVNKKFVYIGAAAVLLIILVYLIAQPKSGGEGGAINEAKKVFKLEEQSEWALNATLGKIKYSNMNVEMFNNLYVVTGEAIVPLKFKERESKMKYSFRYHFIYSDDGWVLESGGSNEIGRVK